MDAAQADAVERWLEEVRCYVILEGESETCVLQKAARPKDTDAWAPGSIYCLLRPCASSKAPSCA